MTELLAQFHSFLSNPDYNRGRVLSKVSTKNYTSDARRFLNWLNSPDLRVITTAKLAEYLSHLSNTNTPRSTIIRHVSSLHRFFTFLEITYQLPKIVFPQVSTPTQTASVGMTDLLTEFKNHLIKQGKSAVTIKNYTSDIRVFLNYVSAQKLELSRLTKDQLTNLTNGYKSYLSSIAHTPSTVSRHFSTLKNFFDYAHDNKYAAGNPLNSVSELVVPVQFTSLNTSRLPKIPKWILALNLALIFFALGTFAFFRLQNNLSPEQKQLVAFIKNNQISVSENGTLRIPSDSLQILAPYLSTGHSTSGTVAGVATEGGSAVTFGGALDENFNLRVKGVVEGGQLISTTTSEPPLIVASDELVKNLNADLLDGHSAASPAKENDIPFVNSTGQLLLGAKTPSIVADNGLTITAPSQVLSTTFGSDGHITLSPDGQGTVDVLTSNLNGPSFLVNNAQLKTGSLIEGRVGNNNTGYDFVHFLSGSTLENKFAVSATGNVFLAGTLSDRYANNIPLSDSTHTTLPSGATSILGALSGAITGSGDGLFTDGGSYLYPTNRESVRVYNSDGTNYVDLSQTGGNGVLNVYSGDFRVQNDVVISGDLSLDSASNTTRFGGIVYTWPTTQTSNYVLSTDGSGTLSWVAQSGGSNLWTSAAGVIYPSTITDDLAIGGTDSTAPFYVSDSGNISTTGTTGISMSGAGAGITFSGSGNHDISATTGTLRLGAATLLGTITGNGQTVSGLGQLTVDNLRLDANTLDTTSGDLTIDAAGGDVSVDANINPSTNNTFDLGTALLQWNNIYGNTIYQDGNQVCDTSGNCPSSNFWQRILGVLSPVNITDDLAIGGTATASAKFQVFANTGNIATDGSLSFTGGTGLIDSTGALSINTTNNQTITTGTGLFTTGGALTVTGLITANGGITIPSGQVLTVAGTVGSDLIPTTTSTYDLGSATNYWDNIYVNNIYSSGSVAGFWQRLLGVLSPVNITDDLAIGGTATSSSKFQIFANTGNATSSGNITLTGSAPTIATRLMRTLTIGDSQTGNLVLHPGTGLISLDQATTIDSTGALSLNTVNNQAITTGTGLTTLGGALSVNGDVTLGNAITDNLTFTGRVAQDSDIIPITTTGTNDLGAPLLPWDNLYVDNIISTGTISGFWQRLLGVLSPANITDDLAIGGTATSSAKFQVFGNTGNIITTGTLTLPNSNTLTGVTNFVRLSQGLSVGGSDTYNFATTGNLTANTGSFDSNVTLNAQGELRLADSDSSNYTGFKSPATIGTNIVYTLPTADGQSNQFLSTNGSGILSWVDASASGAAANFWRFVVGSGGLITPEQNYYSVAIGGSATASAKLYFDAITGNSSQSGTLTLNGNEVAPLIATTLAQTLTIGNSATGNLVLHPGSGLISLDQATTIDSTGALTLNTLNNQAITTGTGLFTAGGAFSVNGDVTLGNAITDNITFTGRVAQDSDIIPITTTGTNDLGAALLPWDNLYVDNIYSNGTTLGFWQRLLGVLSPSNITDDLAIGGTATSSAKFQVFGDTGNATSSGNLTFTGSAPTIATRLMRTLTIGDSQTGNLVLHPGTGLISLDQATTIDSTGALSLNTVNNQAITTGTGLTTLGGDVTINGDALTLAGNSTIIDMTGTGTLGLNTTTNRAITTGTGLFTVGNNFAVNGSVTTNLIPSADGTLDLGSAVTSWDDVYAKTLLSTTTLLVDSAAGTLSLNTTNNQAINTGAGTLTTGGALIVTGATVLNGDVTLGNAITDDITFTGRVAEDSDLIPIGTFGTNDLGAASLPWDNLYVDNIISTGSLSGFWQRNVGTLSPANLTDDLVLGGIATNSATAKFKFINVASGVPTASISGTSANNFTYITGNGNLATTDMMPLTLGGASTGHIQLSPKGTTGVYISGAGNVGINYTSPLQKLVIQETNSVTSGEHLVTNFGNVAATAGVLSGWYADGAAVTGGYLRSFNNTSLFLGAGTSNQTLSISSTSKVGIGNTSPVGKLDLSGAVTGKALAIFNETGDQAIFTASASGTPVFTIGRTGVLSLNQNSQINTAGTLLINSTGTLSLNTTNNAAITTGTGLTTLGGDVTINGDALTLAGNSTIIDMTGTGTLGINTTTNRAITTGTGLFTVGGNETINGTLLSFAGATGTINSTTGTLSINTTNNQPITTGTGQITLNGNVDATNGLDVTNANLTVGGANFSVAEATGNVITAGTLTLPNSNVLTGVAGFVQFANGISVGGATTYQFDSSGNITANAGTFGSTVTIQGANELRFNDSDNSNYTGFKAPTNVTPSNVVYILPPADGTVNQVLTTNGSATLSWVDVTAAAGGGGGNLWSLVGGAGGLITPQYTHYSVSIGGTSTATAKLYFDATNGNSSQSGTLTFNGNDSLPVIASRRFETLQLGDSQTGNLLLTTGTGKTIQFYSSANTIDSSGNLILSGYAQAGNLKLDTNTLSSTTGNLTIDATGNLIIADTTVQFSGGSSTLDILDTINDSTLTISNSGAGNLANLAVEGQIQPGNFVNSGSYPSPELEGGIIYDTTANNLYFWNGTAWTAIGSGSGDSLWTETSNVIYPSNLSDDLAIGGNSTATAKFRVDRNTGTISIRNPFQTTYFHTMGDSGGNLTLSSGGDHISYGTKVIIDPDLQVNGGVIRDANANAQIQFADTGATTFLTNIGNKLSVNATTPSSDAVARFQVKGGVKGKAAVIINETGNQDLLAASTSGVTKYRIDNAGNTYSNSFIDITNTNYFFDPNQTGTSTNIAMAGGFITSAVADSSTAVGFNLNTTNTLSTYGAKLLNLQNNGTDKFYVDKDGNVFAAGTITAGNGMSILLTNKSGGSVANRAIVIIDDQNVSSFTTTTVPYHQKVFGVIVGVGYGVSNDADGDGVCDANDRCMVAFGGEVEVTTVSATTANKGDYIYTSATAGSAVASPAQYDGIVGIVSSTASAGSGYLKMVMVHQPISQTIMVRAAEITNIIVANLRIQNQNQTSARLLENGFADSFVTTTGVDAGLSSSYVYNADEQYYSVLSATETVHDTQGEFTGGQSLNRITTTSSPTVAIDFNDSAANNDILALYEFENNGNDSSLFGRILTSTGTPAFSTSVVKFGSYSHTGSSSNYYTVPTSAFPIMAQGTVSAWIYSTSTAAVQTVFRSSDGTNESYLKINASAQISMKVGAGSAFTSSTTISTSTWTHLAMTWDGSYWRIFKNGTEVDRQVNTATFPASNAVGSNFIGRDSTGNPLVGQIDRLEVNRRAKSEDQIKREGQIFPYAVYTSSVIDIGTTPTTLGPISWTESLGSAGDVEFQTRSSADNSTWEAWKPTTSETQLTGFNTDSANWTYSNSTQYTTSKSNDSTVITEGAGSLRLQNKSTSDQTTSGVPTDVVLNFEDTIQTDGGTAVDEDNASATDFTASTPSPTVTNDGNYGSARTFNGSSTYYLNTSSVGDMAQVAHQTSIGAWIYPTACNGGIAGAFNGSAANTFSFYLNASCSLLIHANGISATGGGGTVPLNQWSHVAGVVAGTTITTFINGIQTGTTTAGTGFNKSGAGYYYIGHSIATSNTYFAGKIDSVVLLTNSTWSAEQIYQLYAQGVGKTITRNLTSADLTNSTKFIFDIASDRPGTHLEATIGENDFQNYVCDANTVSLWTLDSEYNTTSATEGDRCGTNAITWSVAPSWVAQAKISSARSFNGTTTYITPTSTSLPEGSDNRTVDFWFKPTTVDGTDRYVYSQASELTATTNSFQVGYNSTNGWFLDVGAINYTTSSVPVVGTWYHVAVSYDGTHARIYVNGTLVATHAVGTLTTSNSSVLLGAQSGGNYAAGIIDEVRVSNTARSATDIAAVANYKSRSQAISIDWVKHPAAAAAITSGSTTFDVVDTSGEIEIGDKIFLLENQGGTEYIAVNTVTGVSVGATNTTITVVSASWTGTFPGPGFSQYSAVGKYQREYIDVSDIATAEKNAISRFTLRYLNGYQGSNIWLDDMRYGGAYLTTSSGSAITSTAQRYVQYRAILSSSNTTATSPNISMVNVGYTTAGGGSPTGNLISNAYTALIPPIVAYITAMADLGTGTATYYASRDDGTTWTQVPVTEQFTDTGSIKAYSGYVSIANQPSGTDMRWKVAFTGNAKVYGVGMRWEDQSSTAGNGLQSASGTVADGSYLELTHNQATNDLVITAWSQNASASAWNPINEPQGQNHLVSAPDQLAGWWKMNESSGNLTDSSRYGQTLTASGSPAGYSATGKVDRETAILFDGTNDYFACTDANCGGTGELDFAADESFTVGAWFKSSASELDGTILGKRASTGAGYSLDFNSSGGTNYIRCNITDGSTATQTEVTTARDPNWHFYACARQSSSGELAMYMDGDYITGSIDNTTGSLNNTSDFRIGTNGDTTQYILGTVDDAFVYRKRLTTEEIKNLYQYGAKNYRIDQTDTNTVRLYNYSGATQSLRLDIVSGSSAVTSTPYVSLAPTAADVDGKSAANSIWINKLQGNGNLIRLQDDSVDKFTVGWDGHATLAGTLTVGTGSLHLGSFNGYSLINDTLGSLKLQAGGTTGGSSGTSSIFFLNAAGTSVGRIDTAETKSNFGSGGDGSLALSAALNMNTTDSAASIDLNTTYADGIAYKVDMTQAAGNLPNTGNTAILTVDTPSGLVVGDEVLLINMQGATGDVADVGNYEFLKIASIATNTITFTTPIVRTYKGTTATNQKVILQRIPQYTSVTLTSSGSMTASAWDALATTPTGAAGYLTGIVAFRATGTVSIASGTSITAASLGYAGGTGGAAGVNGGNNAESYDGTNGKGSNSGSNNATLGGGDGGAESAAAPANQATRGGGAGGGSGSACASANCGGAGGGGGAHAGGGGGGGGGAPTGGSGGAGGAGGAVGVTGGGGGGGSSSGASAAGGAAGAAGSNGNVGIGGAAGTGQTTGSGGGGANSANGGPGGGGGGGLYGDANQNTMSLGSGGGGGGGNNSTSQAGRDGGKGGGIVFVAANSISVAGTISTNGAAGTAGIGSGGAGGSGAGGSVYVVAGTADLGTSFITASGGAVTSGSTRGGGGGAGGNGYITVNYLTSANGVTSPTAVSNNLVSEFAKSAVGSAPQGTLHIGKVDSANADLAEYYPSDENLLAGEVVALDENKNGYIRRSQSRAEPTLLGIISTDPGLAIGSDTINKDKDSNQFPVALSGRVPVKIDPASEPILIGDQLTSSDIPGLAIRATAAGPVIARALEPWTPDSQKSSIMVFVHLGYYDPMWEQQTGVVTTSDTATSSGSMAAVDENGNLIKLSELSLLPDPLSNESGLIADSATSGGLLNPLVSTESGQTATSAAQIALDKLKNLGSMAMGTINSYSANIFGILKSNQIQTNDIATNLISPLATGSAILINGDASVSGTLYASDLKSPVLDDLSTDIAGISEATAAAQNYVENLFAEALQREDYLRSTANAALLNSTSSAQLLASINESWTSDSAGNHLDLDSVSANTGNFRDFLVQNTLAANTINTIAEGDTLYIQPSGTGYINLLAGVMTLDSTGNVTINGNLAVTGSFTSNTLATNEATVSGQLSLRSKGFGQLLAIYDEDGNTVGSVDASGSAKFKDLAIEQLVIASPATNSGDLSSSTATTSSNTTIGTGIIPANSTEVTINSTLVTENTLIYLTPISNTNNQVLYVKSKSAGTGFTVAISTAIDAPIEFNFWLIKLQ